MNHSFLQKALFTNATFSTACAVALFTFTDVLSQWYGDIPQALLLALGASLLSFAALLIWVAIQKPIQRHWVRLITYADWGWVLGTPVLLAIFYPLISRVGIVLMVLVAMIVAACAVAQGKP